METSPDIKLGWPEMDIAVAITELKGYALSRGDFPARVLLLGNVAWREEAIKLLDLRYRKAPGNLVAQVCNTPYSGFLLQ